MTRKVAAPFFLAFALLAQAVEIRVATFNIGAHLVVPPGGGPAYFDYGIGAPGTPDHDTVRDVLDRIDADVVALQEIHGADFNAGHLTALANGLGYPHVFYAPATNTFDTSLHVAFLSRLPFLTQTLIASPAGARDMNRLIPVVKVDVPGTARDPVLMGAHLKSGSAASDAFQRTVEMRRLTDYLTSSSLTADDNFVILGDFNLSGSDRTFVTVPETGLPASFDLGADIVLPIHYHTQPPAYFSNPAVTHIVPRQLDNSTVTYPNGASAIDLFLVSPIIGVRPLHTEIYNSALDASNTSGLPKAGFPLAAGTSTAASDHLAVFGDIELDPALPYAFHAPGETVSETFAGFAGTYDPYPWVTTGGGWLGVEAGSSSATGFRSYGSTADPSLGLLPEATGGSATASFVNQSTQVLYALQVSFTAEQWRSAFGGSADSLSVELIAGGIPVPLPQLTFHAVTNLPNGSIAGGASTAKSMTVTGLSIAPGATFQLKFTFTPGTGSAALPADVFVNEFHYDNSGTDSGEFIEVVVGPGFTGNPADIDVLLYNGSGTTSGTFYDTVNLASRFGLATTVNGFKIHVADFPTDGIQNGAPDGIAVVNKTTGQVLHFLSYEGSFVANNGQAAGAQSANIGVSQNAETAGQSALGLIGTGATRTDFTWSKIAGAFSKGQPNAGQSLVLPTLPPQGIAIDNLAVTFLSDSDGDGFIDADEAVFGTNPQDANSRFAMTFALPSVTMARLSFPTLTGRSYTVEGSTDLITWSDVATYSGTGNPVVADLPLAPGEAIKFYRIRARMP